MLRRSPGRPSRDPLGVVQVVVELAVAARPAVDDAAADAHDRGIALEGAARAREPVVRRHRVGVEKRDELPAGGLEAGVSGSAGVSARGVPDHAGAGLPRRVRRAVGRGVVHDDDLRGRLRLRAGGRHGVADGAGGIAAGDDDARAHEPASLSRAVPPAAGSGSGRAGRFRAAARGASRSSARPGRAPGSRSSRGASSPPPREAAGSPAAAARRCARGTASGGSRAPSAARRSARGWACTRRERRPV